MEKNLILFYIIFNQAKIWGLCYYKLEYFYDFQETPFPNHYPVEKYDLVSELKDKRFEATFKSSGRKKMPYFYEGRQGDALLPGAYKHKDLIHE